MLLDVAKLSVGVYMLNKHILVFWLMNLMLGLSEILADVPTKTVQLAPGKSQVKVVLKTQPSTGYRWYLKDYDAKRLKPLKVTIKPIATAHNKPLIGGPMQSVWLFKLTSAATTVPEVNEVVFQYMRAWEGQPIRQQIVRIISHGQAK